MFSVTGCGHADRGVAVVAEDNDREPLDRLAVRGVHRRVVEPPAAIRVPVVVELYTPVGQPPGATLVLPAVLTSTSMLCFTHSSGTGIITIAMSAGSFSVCVLAGW